MGGDGEGADRRRGVEVLETRRDDMSMSMSKVEVQAMQVRVRDVAEADGLKCERQIWRRPQERSNMTPMGARVPKGR